MRVHECRRELFVGDCTRKVTGEGRFRKLWLYVKLTDKTEFYGAEGKKHWKPDQWQKIIFSDETQVVIWQNNSVSVWRKNRPRSGSPTAWTNEKGQWSELHVWGCITYDGIGAIVPVDGNLNSTKYIELLDNSLWPVIVQVFVNRPFIFQDDNAKSPPPPFV